MRKNNVILIIVFFLVIFHVKGICQEQEYLSNEKTQLNCLDSSGRKIGLWIEYDIENIKYSEIKYSKPNKVEYVKYFTRSGKEIKKYTWKINSYSLNRLIEFIRNKFVYNDLSAGSGSSILLLIADCENNIFEIRVIKGISKGFNDEIIRVTKELESNLIFICPSTCKMPIISHFAIHVH